jgi:hypothetical protein
MTGESLIVGQCGKYMSKPQAKQNVYDSIKVEDVEQVVIPTAAKSKVSGSLSYPVGAERISAALASCAQRSEIKLNFYSSRFNRGSRSGCYEFLRVEYLNNGRPAQEGPILDLWGRPPQGRWEIVVQPVPRVVRRRVNQYIVGSALQQISKWLDERTHLAKRGNDILAFFYDEKSEEFTARQLTRLEPIRG